MLMAQSTFVKKGVCTPIGIRHASSDGMMVPVVSGQTVTVNASASATGLSLYSDNTCTQPASSVPIPGGEGGKPVFVKAADSGLTVTLSATAASASALSGATLTLTTVQ